eukprot:CAMPEP_0202727616 /NCGR_PEP_ID=MMETSP1385-20130828/185212_1 /ASSEMBLY_ACC=CAM_ASM_000861 /TAXON_ID=933848 /ORGANISM="Elphidium margaritaceum" /LENGTH=976 /DNA_ID=CAMNT_0049393859 /DNA_START=37 /DNA_END=2967 /DNA_ORIENTATION=+
MALSFQDKLARFGGTSGQRKSYKLKKKRNRNNDSNILLAAARNKLRDVSSLSLLRKKSVSVSSNGLPQAGTNELVCASEMAAVNSPSLPPSPFQSPPQSPANLLMMTESIGIGYDVMTPAQVCITPITVEPAVVAVAVPLPLSKQLSSSINDTSVVAVPVPVHVPVRLPTALTAASTVSNTLCSVGSDAFVRENENHDADAMSASKLSISRSVSNDDDDDDDDDDGNVYVNYEAHQSAAKSECTEDREHLSSPSSSLPPLTEPIAKPITSASVNESGKQAQVNDDVAESDGDTLTQSHFQLENVKAATEAIEQRNDDDDNDNRVPNEITNQNETEKRDSEQHNEPHQTSRSALLTTDNPRASLQIQIQSAVDEWESDQWLSDDDDDAGNTRQTSRLSAKIARDPSPDSLLCDLDASDAFMPAVDQNRNLKYTAWRQEHEGHEEEESDTDDDDDDDDDDDLWSPDTIEARPKHQTTHTNAKQHDEVWTETETQTRDDTIESAALSESDIDDMPVPAPSELQIKRESMLQSEPCAQIEVQTAAEHVGHTLYDALDDMLADDSEGSTYYSDTVADDDDGDDDDDDDGDSAQPDCAAPITSTTKQVKQQSWSSNEASEHDASEHEEDDSGDMDQQIQATDATPAVLEEKHMTPSPPPNLEPRMSLQEFLKKFNLHTHHQQALFKYFSVTLHIRFADEVANFSPTMITRPPHIQATKARMGLHKMAEYISSQIGKREWTSEQYESEWLQLNDTKIISAVSPKFDAASAAASSSSLMAEFAAAKLRRTLQRSSDIFFEGQKGSSSTSNHLRLVGHKKIFIDKAIALDTRFTLSIEIEEAPNDSQEKRRLFHTMIIGVTFHDAHGKEQTTMYISERCCVFIDDKHVAPLTYNNLKGTDVGSEIVFTIENTTECPNIEISHYRNGRMIDHNRGTFVMQKLKQKTGGFAKIFVEQFCGFGEYAVFEHPESNLKQMSTSIRTKENI